MAATTASATANITVRTLTVSATGQDKVYDGTTTAGVTLSSDQVIGDVLSLSDTSDTFSDKNVGTGKTVSVNGIGVGGTDAGNYTLASTTASTSANITVRTLNISASGQNKVYDGTSTATVTLSSDHVLGDVLTLSNTSATFADKNVGTGKTVSVSGIGVVGTDAGNYTLVATTTSTSANITVRTLTVSASGQNKVYDGTATASVTLSSDQVLGDVLNLSDTIATFADKNVGTGQTVSVSGIGVSGTDAGNYTLASTTASTSANITVRTLNVSASGQNKVYDGTTTAGVTLSSDQVIGDVLSLSDTSATFADKNIGSGKTVSVSGIGVSGADAGNYTLASTTASTTGMIRVRTLTVSASGQNKVYDGTTTAGVTLSSDQVLGDVLSLSDTSATFVDKNVGAGKTVSVSGIGVSGTDAGNYTLASTTASTSANITVRTLTVSATGQNKVYDGTTTAGVTLSSDQVIGDVLSLSDTSATFADKNVGTGKTISVSCIGVSGIDAGNYDLASTTASTLANITVRTLTVSATGQNKVYDGTTTAGVTLSSDQVIGNVLSLSDTSATFVDSNYGIHKAIRVSGITITGTDASNYTLASTSVSTTASITAAFILRNPSTNVLQSGITNDPATNPPASQNGGAVPQMTQNIQTAPSSVTLYRDTPMQVVDFTPEKNEVAVPKSQAISNSDKSSRVETPANKAPLQKPSGPQKRSPVTITAHTVSMTRVLAGGTSSADATLLVATLDVLGRQLGSVVSPFSLPMGEAALATAAMSVGYVVWYIRGLSLSSSLLSMLPLWKWCDPLPILAARKRKSKRPRAGDSNPEIDDQDELRLKILVAHAGDEVASALGR